MDGYTPLGLLYLQYCEHKCCSSPTRERGGERKRERGESERGGEGGKRERGGERGREKGRGREREQLYLKSSITVIQDSTYLNHFDSSLACECSTVLRSMYIIQFILSFSRVPGFFLFSLYCGVCSMRSMPIRTFILIGCVVRELHSHLCPYCNVWLYKITELLHVGFILVIGLYHFTNT